MFIYPRWPAATNLITNGGFETNTTGWAGVRATIARSTSASKFGAACMSVTSTADFAYARFDFGALADATYALSFWMTDGDQAPLTGYYSFNDGPTEFASGVFNASADWVRVTDSGTTSGSPTNVYLDIYCRFGGGAVGDQLLVDGVQVETGSIATPYIETDGGTATRAKGPTIPAINNPIHHAIAQVS